MISTLIRGSSTLPPPTGRYREEYLVDTETNEIIYPKVLPSSITIPPSEGDSTPTIPGVFGCGIDPNSYIYKRVSISGQSINLASSWYFEEEVPSPGIYWIQSIICPNGSKIGSLNDWQGLALNIWAVDTEYEVQKYKSAYNLSSCYTQFNLSGVLPVKHKVRSKIFLNASNTTGTFSSKAYYLFCALKLCDLPEDHI